MKAAIFALLLLNGCALVPSAVVGAALTPFVQPMVDRALDKLGLGVVDPGGVQAVKQ